MSNHELVIVTDDLTSATDGTACFAANGWKVSILRPGWTAPGEAAILSIDIDSRTEPTAIGTKRIDEQGVVLRRAAAVVKQFDSTLRGPISSECRAVLKSSGRRSLFVLAAFPSERRTTVNGVQLLDGIPVDQTEFRRDPLNPVRESSLVRIFKAQFHSVACADSVAEVLAAARSHEVVIINAVEEQQLDEITTRLFGARDVVWAGSTGLLRSLSRTIYRSKVKVHFQFQKARAPLLVVGSRSQVSRQQLNQIAGADAVIVVDPGRYDVSSVIEKVKRRNGQPTAITSVESDADPAMASLALAEVAANLLEHGVIDGLVTTGGETTKHVLQAAGVVSIEVVAEIEPGIPMCLARSDERTFPIATKAGAFGSERVLTRAVEFMSA